MLSVADDIADALRTLREETGVAAVYWRGDTQIALGNVSRGRWVFRFEDEYHTTKRIETRDFLVAAEELVIGGVPVEPVIGDRIQETVAGDRITYEVVSVNNEPCFRWSDPGRTQLRIHSLRIKTEDV